VGVLAIEFFYGPGGLQINEIAPRTHNSGHYTIEACPTSQFAQQVRIVTGLPLGSTEARLPAALMVNLLAGSEPLAAAEQAERLQRLRMIPQASLHWYGKRGHRRGRKLGHLTIALQGATAAERQQQGEQCLALVRSIWPLPEPQPGGSGP
jgi:5-(carboxyamino)imidazole ribonucleotide synthase